MYIITYNTKKYQKMNSIKTYGAPLDTTITLFYKYLNCLL